MKNSFRKQLSKKVFLLSLLLSTPLVFPFGKTVYCSEPHDKLAIPGAGFREQLLAEIEEKQHQLDELQMELTEVPQIVTKQGVFYPLPNIAKWATATAAVFQIIEMSYASISIFSKNQYGALESLKSAHHVLRNRAIVFLATLSAFVGFNYWSQPRQEIIYISDLQRAKLLAHYSELSQQIGELKSLLKEIE